MPKQASAAAPTAKDGDDTEALFVKLSNALEDTDYKKCLKLCDTILTSAKGDKDALKAKLYANIMLGRNDDALQLIQSQKSIAADVVFEKAYCLFRTGRLDAALELLQGAEDEGSLHLSAIIHMRQRHTQAASAVYSSLAPKVKGNTQGAIELATNMIAALVMSGEQSRIPRTLQQFSVAAKDSFEVALNMACAAVLDGQLKEAQRLLQLAETKGLEVLIEEDVSQAEMDQELAPVRAQAALVNFLQGDKAAAAAGYASLLLQNVQSDVALHAVCTNNSLCTQQNMDTLPKDARKKLDAFIETAEVAVSETAERRLGASACSALLRNYILSSLPTSSSGPKASSDGSATSAGLQKAAQAAAEAAPDSEAAMLLHAAAVGLLSSTSDGIGVIRTWVESHSDSDATTALLLGSHLACCGSAPNFNLGLELLSHDRLPGTVRHACAAVATRAAMHEKISGDEAVERLQQEAEAAAEFWQEQPASEEQASSLVGCVEHQVVLCLRQGTPEAALQRLQDLQKSQSVSNRPAVRARLLRCLAAIDAKAVPEVAADVGASSGVPGVNVKDAEELEVSHIVSKGTSVLCGPLVRQNEGEGGKSGKTAKKRKRKLRYPKGFDPDNPDNPPPDPERWLPKHERAEFRKRRKRSQRNQPVSKGAQGMGAVDSSLDKSHITMEELDARAQPAAVPRLPARSAPKGSQGKRKGKR